MKYTPLPGQVLLTEDQRDALFDLLESAMVGLRCYYDPLVETPADILGYQCYVTNIGRVLHNVPVWLKTGYCRPGDFEWVMAQKNNGRLP